MAGFCAFPSVDRGTLRNVPRGLLECQFAENGKQQLPAVRDRSDVDPFSRRMRAANIRSERHHVHARIFFADQTTFQTGVNHLDRAFGGKIALEYL